MKGAHRKTDGFGRRLPRSRAARSLYLRANPAEIMIEADTVSKMFGSVCALNSVSVSVPRGTVLGLLGHNGAGKTTLVNILATALPPTSGRASIAGFDVMREPQDVRRRIGLTGQFASVDDQLTGRDNLILIARLLGASRRAAGARADALLELFGLGEFAKRRASAYSGGLRRRLDLAASLVGSPDVIFLDEPTTGLDPSSRLRLWEIVEDLVAEGTTILLTTQYLDEADRLADSITLLSAGAVVASGTAAELKARVGQRRVTVTLNDAEEAGFAYRTLKGAGMTLETGRDRNTLILAAGASQDVVNLIGWLEYMKIEPVELSFGNPSLDDVYLALSGNARPQPLAAPHPNGPGPPLSPAFPAKLEHEPLSRLEAW